MEPFYLTCRELVDKLGKCSLLSVIGFTTVLYCSVSVLKVVVYTPFKLYYLAQILPPCVDLTKLGRWAVVTGATDGIGKGYAQALAKRGLDVVLISRSDEKLSRVEKELKDEYGVKVQTVAVDFKRTDIYDEIEKVIKGLDIAILVNNVGMSSTAARFHLTENVQSLTVDMLHVNCVSMTNMCALVLPHMLAKKKGVIVNISSLAANGFIPTSVYSATKAYVSLFSDCLRRTYTDSGVIIQTLETGMVNTNMVSRSLKINDKPIRFMETFKSFAVPVSSYVQSALNTIGWSDKHEGHVSHYFTARLGGLMSKASQDKVILRDIDALQ